MSGYEAAELGRIEAALDDLVSPTSEDVFQATRPYDERAIASVAAKRAGDGGGGAQPLLWAAFDSLVGVEQADGIAGVLGFQTSFIGAGTLTSCTVGVVGGDPAILLPDVGCYLISVNVALPDFAFGDLSGSVQLITEIQVLNSESDPYLSLVKGVTGSMESGVLTAVCNVLASDDPATSRGFAVTTRAQGTTFTPPANDFAVKVVQLATT